MIKTLNRKTLQFGAAFMTGVMGSTDAFAANGTAPACKAGESNFNCIAGNILNSVSSLPGLLTGLAFLSGTLLGVLGILKIKDHVENPSNTPMKEGAIRLVAGGALFSLPIIFDAMQTTSDGGVTAAATNAATLQKAGFNVQ